MIRSDPAETAETGCDRAGRDAMTPTLLCQHGCHGVSARVSRPAADGGWMRRRHNGIMVFVHALRLGRWMTFGDSY